MTPFYYEDRDVWLLPITNEQADDLFRDMTLRCSLGGVYWWEDTIERYNDTRLTPSSMIGCKYAIEVGEPEQ